MNCKYGNTRCICQDCKHSAAYEHCTSGYCSECLECENVGKAINDVILCTEHEKIEEAE